LLLELVFVVSVDATDFSELFLVHFLDELYAIVILLLLMLNLAGLHDLPVYVIKLLVECVDLLFVHSNHLLLHGCELLQKLLP